MANIKMKTLTVGEDVFEIVDEQAREDIKELQENGVKTSVESVNGKTGVVTLDASDVGALSVSDIVDGLTSTESNKALSARLGFQLNSKLTTLRNEFDNLEGDGTIEVDMEEGTFSHKDSGVAANWYGEQGGGDLNFGASFTVPGALNIDAKGHITEAKDNQFKLPDNEATEAKKGLLSSTDKAKLNKLKPPFNFELNNNSASNVDVNVTLFDADEETVAEFGVVGRGRAKVSRNSTSGALEINVEKETVDLSGYATTQQLATVEGKIPTVAQEKGWDDNSVMSQSAVTFELRNLDDALVDHEEWLIRHGDEIGGLSEEIVDLPNNETLIDNVAEVVKTEVPLVKTAEQPTIVSSVDEMTDTSKQYVLSTDGYFYAYTESNAENYNLLKLSEVSYSSRLQNDVSGIIASNVNNLVTGWIPVQYGKYYTPSVLYNGSRITGNSAFSLIVRVNVLLDDGTIVAYGNTVTDRNAILYAPGVNETITLEHENAVAIMLHFLVGNNDISTKAKFEAYEPMVIEGDSIDDATNKSTTYEYINGDTELESIVKWHNTGLAYNQPADYEDRIRDLESEIPEIQEELTELKTNMGNPSSASPYYRDVNFGIAPSAYYQGVAESYENNAFGWTTKYADYMTMWKALVDEHSGYVTETALGTASDGQTIYLYDFKPVRISNEKKDVPKIIIVAGQHGGETANIFGLYYFVNNLLNRWNQHPALEYLRNHVELMIIPVLNTYGFDNRSYTNANGVNLNRNYDSNWSLVADTTSNQYGGANPFDQSETQIVRDLLLNNKDAVLIIDSHVNGGGKVANYSDINYYGICASTDSYYNRMVDAVAHNLSAISGNFNLDYELGHPNTIMGFLNNADGVGLLRNWAVDNDFVGVLVEGFGGFPNGTAYASEVFKANEEIIVNWLITAMNYLGK